MKNTKWNKRWKLLCTAFGILTASVNVSGAEKDVLLSVEGEAQIREISDGSGTYLLKSDGFYCLKADGSKDQKPAVHYFDHLEIDGTVFNGYYYHDAEGRFQSASPHVEQLKNLTIAQGTEEYAWNRTFDGYYMVNNLGRLTAAPQIRYMDQLVMNGTAFQGYYYFDEYGRMTTEPGIHYIEMTSNGQMFQGNYYFGGPNGVLEQKAGMTEEGFPVDETGKVGALEDLGMDTLHPLLEQMLSGYQGTWSVYVKDMNTGEKFAVNNQQLYSASLIKTFVMAKTYENMETVLSNEGKRMNKSPEDPAVQAKVEGLLENMITVSDNESYNELIRLQTETHDFLKGAQEVNTYLEKEGYKETTVQHTLAPSASPSVGLGGNNKTSVEDCGKILEKIYQGKCVSKEASEKMLELLLNQKKNWKIPEGISGDIKIANKTGETDKDQHDIAIVYGPKTTYIVCVMSEDFPNEAEAIKNIQEVSKVVYNYLNLGEVTDG